MRIAQIVTLFLLSLVAGVFWGTWFSQWFHTIRTFASLAGLLCMLGSTVYGTQRAPGTTGA